MRPAAAGRLTYHRPRRLRSLRRARGAADPTYCSSAASTTRRFEVEDIAKSDTSITPLLPLHRLTPRSPFSSVPSVSPAVQFPNLLIKITFELHLRHLRKKGLYPHTVSHSIRASCRAALPVQYGCSNTNFVPNTTKSVPKELRRPIDACFWEG